MACWIKTTSWITFEYCTNENAPLCYIWSIVILTNDGKECFHWIFVSINLPLKTLPTHNKTQTHQWFAKLLPDDPRESTWIWLRYLFLYCFLAEMAVLLCCQIKSLQSLKSIWFGVCCESTPHNLNDYHFAFHMLEIRFRIRSISFTYISFNRHSIVNRWWANTRKITSKMERARQGEKKENASESN